MENFVKTVMDYLKGGDDTKLKRFHKTYVVSNKKQINLINDEIAELEEEKNDLEEEQKDAMLNIDFDEIKTVGSTKDYIEKYRKVQVEMIKRGSELDDKIEVLKEERAIYTELNDQVS